MGSMGREWTMPGLTNWCIARSIYIRVVNTPYYGREWINMLKRIEACVLKLLYKYYQAMADYCYRKVDAYGPEHNDFWCMRTVRYTDKELKMVYKLMKLGEI